MIHAEHIRQGIILIGKEILLIVINITTLIVMKNDEIKIQIK